jgi:Tol biopolymer transport system component
MDGNRIIWVQTDSRGSSIYYKDLATGYKTKIYSSKQIIKSPDISGTIVVWEQYDSNNKSTIYYKNLATGASGEVMHSLLNQLMLRFLALV